ncbi:Zinc finger C2H2 [Penicillium longicatenatum]|nr:Zinc finger C2H2 [Penicillium longicatenatum]
MARGSSTERKTSTTTLSSNIVSVLNSPATSASPSPEPSPSMVGRKSTMRRSPQADVSMPITYTPTTHRISKAKKGKRVHACEFPGCNKVFTRAEHRRRHELNHNPEASYRCTQMGCKKAFHRPDLLARHMERHELESQPEQSQWAPRTQTPMTGESASIPRCISMDNNSLMAGTSQPNSMSIGSLVAPGVHPDLANDCSLVWSGMDLPLQHPRPSTNLFHNQLPEPADDSPFYSSPAETCPSPLSDTNFSLPTHSSSISSGSVSLIDAYPKSMMKTDLTASPMQMHSPLRWDGSDVVPTSHMMPISLEDSLIQPPVQCHYPSPSYPSPSYPSPSWSSPDCLPYDDQVQSLAHFQPLGWKQWAM